MLRADRRTKREERTVQGNAELTAALENTMHGAIRKRGTNKVRDDGTERPFGGINWLLVGDWWQLPPVMQTSLTANPFKEHSASVQKILAMWWTRDVDALTQPELRDGMTNSLNN